MAVTALTGVSATIAQADGSGVVDTTTTTSTTTTTTTTAPAPGKPGSDPVVYPNLGPKHE